MRRRAILTGLTALALSGMAGEASAAPPRRAALDALLKKLAKSRAGLKTLQASFEQTRVIGLLATKVKSKGHLTMVLPAQLRWDLAPPDDVSYWIGPKGIAMRNSEGVSKLGKSAAGRFATVLTDLLQLLGGDIAKLEKRYAMQLDGKRLTLIPKTKAVAKHIRKLELQMDAMLVTRVSIIEKSGDRSDIVFGKYTKNAKVEAKRMRPSRR